MCVTQRRTGQTAMELCPPSSKFLLFCLGTLLIAACPSANTPSNSGGQLTAAEYELESILTAEPVTSNPARRYEALRRHFSSNQHYWLENAGFWRFDQYRPVANERFEHIGFVCWLADRGVSKALKRLDTYRFVSSTTVNELRPELERNGARQDRVTTYEHVWVSKYGMATIEADETLEFVVTLD